MSSTRINQLCITQLAWKLVPRNPVRRISPSSSSSSSTLNLREVHHCLRASSEGYQNELVEESKFVPVDPEDPRYGPPSLLLLGFKVEEADQMQQLLKDLDGEFMQIIYCTEDMIARSLWEAVNTRQQSFESVKIAESLPRICFLSGLSGQEMMMFIEAFQESGIERTIFAALVPNSSDKPLEVLIEEIMGDHEMMSAQQSEQ